jgi:hypothetical protein
LSFLTGGLLLCLTVSGQEVLQRIAPPEGLKCLLRVAGAKNLSAGTYAEFDGGGLLIFENKQESFDVYDTATQKPRKDIMVREVMDPYLKGKSRRIDDTTSIRLEGRLLFVLHPEEGLRVFDRSGFEWALAPELRALGARDIQRMTVLGEKRRLLLIETTTGEALKVRITDKRSVNIEERLMFLYDKETIIEIENDFNIGFRQLETDENGIGYLQERGPSVDVSGDLRGRASEVHPLSDHIVRIRDRKEKRVVILSPQGFITYNPKNRRVVLHRVFAEGLGHSREVSLPMAYMVQAGGNLVIAAKDGRIGVIPLEVLMNRRSEHIYVEEIFQDNVVLSTGVVPARVRVSAGKGIDVVAANEREGLETYSFIIDREGALVAQ